MNNSLSLVQLKEMEHFLNITLDFYLVLDQEKQIILKSSNFDNYFYSFDTINDFSNLLIKNKRDKFLASIKNDEVQFNVKVFSKKNDPIYLNWTATIFESQRYTFYRITDNTELVLRQKDLLTAKEILDKALDFMPGPVYTKDREGRFLFTNSVFKEVVGSFAVDVIGKTNHEIFDKNLADSLYKNDLDVIKNNKTIHFREDVPHLDGSIRNYDTYKFPLLDTEGKPFAVTGISIDITQKLKMEKELEERKAKFVQSSKLSTLGEMAGGIAHEINTPLSIIKATAFRITRLIQKDKIDINEVLKSTESIDSTVSRISTIIKGLRNFSRDGELDDDEDFNLLGHVQEVLSFCKEKLKINNIGIQIDQIDPNLNLSFNRTQLSQVILNLLNNAIDALDGKKIKWIKIETRLEDSKLIFSISDSGSGVAKEIKDKIMEPFFTTKPIGHGTGIGLSISRNILESYGCFLNLDKQSEYTKFDIIFSERCIVSEITDNISSRSSSTLYEFNSLET